MARYYGLRGLIVGLAFAVTASMTATATTIDEGAGLGHNGTASTTADGWSDAFSVVMYSIAHAPMFALPAVATREQPKRDYPRAFRPAAMTPIPSGAAVRPSSVAGWRSGRTRHLAVC